MVLVIFCLQLVANGQAGIDGIAAQQHVVMVQGLVTVTVNSLHMLPRVTIVQEALLRKAAVMTPLVQVSLRIIRVFQNGLSIQQPFLIIELISKIPFSIMQATSFKQN